MRDCDQMSILVFMLVMRQSCLKLNFMLIPEQLGTPTTDVSEGGRGHVIHREQHTLLLLEILVRCDADLI